MMKHQILICFVLVTCVSAGIFSSQKGKGNEKGKSSGLKTMAKDLFFGKKTDDSDEDDFQEEPLSFNEEEDSRKKATIDGETMTKMADVNNNDIPILSLDDQAAIVDKGVDFSKPFDINIVKSKLAEVVKEKLPPDAPPMTTEELFSVKETMEKPADPETAKAIAEVKKEASSKKRQKPVGMSFLNAAKQVNPEPPSPSSGGVSFFDRVIETAQSVGKQAEHLVENFKEKYVDDKPADGHESDNDKPASGSESDNDKPSSGAKPRKRTKISME